MEDFRTLLHAEYPEPNIPKKKICSAISDHHEGQGEIDPRHPLPSTNSRNHKDTNLWIALRAPTKWWPESQRIPVDIRQWCTRWHPRPGPRPKNANARQAPNEANVRAQAPTYALERGRPGEVFSSPSAHRRARKLWDPGIGVKGESRFRNRQYVGALTISYKYSPSISNDSSPPLERSLKIVLPEVPGPRRVFGVARWHSEYPDRRVVTGMHGMKTAVLLPACRAFPFLLSIVSLLP
ncbi:hypothetical protein C8R45DRAFT_947198 [Mycena sanguinolenta]|nr:hypothetical protein C8R45DRAFT_947198 [Mycena sanguinolenta]